MLTRTERNRLEAALAAVAERHRGKYSYATVMEIAEALDLRVYTPERALRNRAVVLDVDDEIPTRVVRRPHSCQCQGERHGYEHSEGCPRRPLPNGVAP